ncbi:hypoxanthine phosphoribosyltransferase [Rhodoblastus sp.]|uniref:hypoxanthine phosphoribosyltransferase n=1 Tax=Rhodoblastus sp. TaxID=1962975 RepID=UPI0026032253|nr:hypoxanthine phosphoribosyltransferase [Rhodoblastus sp.]
MSDGTATVLFDEASIAARVEDMARGIVAARPRDLIAIPIMTGAFVFAADLLRALHRAGLAPEVDFLQVASYGAGTTSSGQIRLMRELRARIEDRDALLIDDILESGRTLAFARKLLIERGARRVMTAALLEKPHKKEIAIHADFVGFSCPDRFVVGYGMDHAGFYRQLPYVGVIEGV